MSRTTYLSAQEVADELAVDVQTVRRWIHAGDLRAVKPGKEFRIKEGDLEGFLGASEARPKAEAPPAAQRSFDDLAGEERRERYLGQLELSARIANDWWSREIERDVFSVADYEHAGEDYFVRLDAELASAMSEGGVQGEAWNRAFASVEALRDTLGRARQALLDRPGADVADLAEYRDSHTGVDARSA